MNNVKRNHVLKLMFDFFNGIFKEFIFIFFAYKFLNKRIGSKVTILILTACIFLDIIITILNWYKTVYYIKDRSIFYEKGVLNVIKREIPFDKIDTIDISQSIFERIFNLSKIKIDTGNVKSTESEISLVLSNKKITQIKEMLINKNEENKNIIKKNEHKIYTLRFKDLIKYSLACDGVFKGIGLIFVLYNFLDEYVGKFIKFNISHYFEGIKVQAINNKIYFLILFIIGIVIVSICFTIVYNCFKYYNFKIYNDENNKLNISYGLIDKKNYSFDIKKIKGIYIKQNLLMQILNIRTIEIESIGYGDEKGEKAILYPVCNEKFQNEVIKNLIPEFLFTNKKSKPPFKAYPRFVFKKIIFVIIIGMVILYKFKKLHNLYIELILLGFVIFLGHMQYRNTVLGISDKLVYMSYNGFFRNEAIIKKSSVQCLKVSYNYFQNKVGVCNYTINIFGNFFGKDIKVKNLSNKLIDSYLYDFN